MTPRERAEAEARELFVIERHKDLGDVWWTVSRESALVASAMSDAGAAARRDEHAAPIADAIERAILAALAEQAAGEAERTAQAVARAYEDAASIVYVAGDRHREQADEATAQTYYALADAICASAASPAPEPAAAERAVVEAADAWRAALDGPGECWHEARLREAVDALAAARRGGG